MRGVGALVIAEEKRKLKNKNILKDPDLETKNLANIEIEIIVMIVEIGAMIEEIEIDQEEIEMTDMIGIIGTGIMVDEIEEIIEEIEEIVAILGIEAEEIADNRFKKIHILTKEDRSKK